MTLPTHALTGLVIGTVLGHPAAGVLVACLPDIDHLYSYIKHGYLENWNSFYKNAFGKDDANGDQRNILHNVLVAVFISSIIFFALPAYFLVITLAYASHLILDALDTSDYYPLYPWRGITIRGFVDFYSWQEGMLFAILLVTYLAIIIK